MVQSDIYTSNTVCVHNTKGLNRAQETTADVDIALWLIPHLQHDHILHLEEEKCHIYIELKPVFHWFDIII